MADTRGVTDTDDMLLSQQEVNRLVLVTVAGAGEQGRSADEVARVIEWANDARLNAKLLEMTLNGQIAIWVSPDGDVYARSLSDESDTISTVMARLERERLEA